MAQTTPDSGPAPWPWTLEQAPALEKRHPSFEMHVPSDDTILRTLSIARDAIGDPFSEFDLEFTPRRVSTRRSVRSAKVVQTVGSGAPIAQGVVPAAVARAGVAPRETAFIFTSVVTPPGWDAEVETFFDGVTKGGVLTPPSIIFVPNAGCPEFDPADYDAYLRGPCDLAVRPGFSEWTCFELVSRIDSSTKLGFFCTRADVPEWGPDDFYNWWDQQVGPRPNAPESEMREGRAPPSLTSLRPIAISGKEITDGFVGTLTAIARGFRFRSGSSEFIIPFDAIEDLALVVPDAEAAPAVFALFFNREITLCESLSVNQLGFQRRTLGEPPHVVAQMLNRFADRVETDFLRRDIPRLGRLSFSGSMDGSPVRIWPGDGAFLVVTLDQSCLIRDEHVELAGFQRRNARVELILIFSDWDANQPRFGPFVHVTDLEPADERQARFWAWDRQFNVIHLREPGDWRQWVANARGQGRACFERSGGWGRLNRLFGCEWSDDDEQLADAPIEGDPF